VYPTEAGHHHRLCVERAVTATCASTLATPDLSIRNDTRGGRPAAAVLGTLRSATTGRGALAARTGLALPSSASVARAGEAATRTHLIPP
jgi:hypothetical protein